MSKALVVAYCLWGMVAVFMVSAWVIGLFWPAQWHFSVLLACSACATSALAATAHIKVYLQRTCALFRNATKAQRSGNVKSLRP